jgi:hypothetical protein
MTRRRDTRRRHRAERRERPAGSAGPAVAPATSAAPAGRDISWTGLLGGVIGMLAIGQSAVYMAFGLAEDESRWWSLPLFATAAIYVPAILVSVRPTPRRRQVLRAVLAVSLGLMVVGAVLFDAAIFGLLLIPSALLAIAAGMLFERRG